MKIMKNPSRFSTISACLVVLLLVLSPAIAQFREEMATLETMYESRARAVVNTVLRPYEYSLVVAVDIDKDETRLAKLQEEFEKDLLPGMPGGINSENPAIANQLHEMKSKVDIHLVLANKITKEKEETISSLLKMKLHLDEKNGDSLTIVRSELPSEKEEVSATKLPELSWKMWGMITATILLLLSGLFFYLSRKTNKSDKKEDEKKDKEENVKPDLEKQKTDANEATAENKDNDTLPELDPTEIMFEQKQQILSLASQYPEATIQALTEHFQKGHEHDVLYLCEAFGWELAKKIFAGFSPRIWGRMGHMLIAEQEKPDVNKMIKALEVCNKNILKKFLELGDVDSKNPFAFIWKLGSYDRSKLLANESAQNIALICAHGDSEQVGEIMESLDPITQEAVTVCISRLQSFNEQQTRAVNDSLIKKLKQLKENPEVKANGIEIVSDLLRALPAEKESAFFEKILLENPVDAEKVRRRILLYADIKYVPADIISEVSAMLDISVLVNALRKGNPETKEYILKALPPKKSYMIQRDLELDVSISDRQSALSQREIVKTITALLKAKNLELVELLKDSKYNKIVGSKPKMERPKAA
ncbi:MAG: hypothetical protein L6Q37_00725 [Bdellovibrionaceae bacterium]|nr:hypothetical protein [Pseudobdellovibrionaceae bacterium]